jgi:hypothetical protein
MCDYYITKKKKLCPMGLFLDIITIFTAMKLWVNTQQINLRVGREEWGGGGGAAGLT